jgi:uncharacterized protein Usg
MMPATTFSDLRKQLAGYGLTTAQILYGMPDHPLVLQLYIWQDYDLAPKYPVLHKFLDFWEEKLDGPLRGVSLVHRRLIAAREVRTITAEFRFN